MAGRDVTVAAKLLLFRSAALVAAAVILIPLQPSAYVLQPYQSDTLQVPFYVNTQSLDVPESAALSAL